MRTEINIRNIFEAFIIILIIADIVLLMLLLFLVLVPRYLLRLFILIYLFV